MILKKFLRIRGLRVYFNTPEGLVKAIDNVELDVYEGEVLAIVGESGSGKSVLGLTILGLLPSNTIIKGSIIYDSINLVGLSENTLRKIRGTKIAWIPQDTDASLNPVLKVGFQIAETPLEHGKLNKNLIWDFSEKLLELLGVKPPFLRAREYPHQLSGGMKQRVLVAIGVSGNPRLLIVDEPTKGIDVIRKRKLLNLFKNIKNSNPKLTILLITHDIKFIEELADRIAVMYCGQIAEVSTKTRFFTEPLHPYSKMLLESLPSRGLKPIPGEPPSMINPPMGCRFHPRCPYLLDTCRVLEPPLVEVNGNYVKCWKYVSDQQ